MARYAMVDTASGIVVNVIEWSGNEEEWRPPAECTMVVDEAAICGAGWRWDGQKFNPPPSGEPGTAAPQSEPQT